MPGRLAVDFGTSNTVVAVWDEARQEGISLHLPDLGQFPRVLGRKACSRPGVRFLPPSPFQGEGRG